MESDPLPYVGMAVDSTTASSSFVRRAFSLISIEPAIFLHALGIGLSSIISQNLLIEKVCLVNLNYDPVICSNLTSFRDNEKEVEKVVASINMYLNILTSIPAIIVSLFLGPWSDVNGRKPLLIFPQIGIMLTQSIYVINAYQTSLPGEFILLASIGSLFGGMTALFIGVYSYISDVSTGQARTYRIALIDLFVFVGYPLGTFLSGPLYKYGGYYTVFGLAIGVTLLSNLYVASFIPDTRGPYCENSQQQNYDFIGAFSIWNIVEVFKTCLKSRDNHVRPILVLLITAMLYNMSTINSSPLIYYLTRLKFGWTEQDFTVWVSITSTTSSFATLCVMPLLCYKLKLHDMTIGIIGSVSGFVCNLVRTFATHPWMFYLSTGIGLVSYGPSIIIRSFLSKIIPSDELGSVFSMLASLEACVPLMTAPIFTIVYEKTIDYFPAAILLISAIMFVLIMIHFLVVFVLVRMGTPDMQQNSENDEIISILGNEVIPDSSEVQEE